MVEGACLESMCRGNSTVGSNPTLSAIPGLEKVKAHQEAWERGEVPEWSNGAVSKTVDRLRDPWVRIPPSPPCHTLGRK